MEGVIIASEPNVMRMGARRIPSSRHNTQPQSRFSQRGDFGSTIQTDGPKGMLSVNGVQGWALTSGVNGYKIWININLPAGNSCNKLT
jgi:hypothetical protein